MLNVQNKKVVGEIARTTYQANRKQNLLIIFAIVLTTFLIAVIIAIGTGYWNTVTQRQIRMQGMDYDIELSEPREDQADKIKSMDNVQCAGLCIKCAILEAYQGQIMDKTRLYWLDETCWEEQTIPALESYKGHYPQRENEIMLGRNTLKAMGISNPEIGMKLVIDYYSLAEDDAGASVADVAPDDAGGADSGSAENVAGDSGGQGDAGASAESAPEDFAADVAAGTAAGSTGDSAGNADGQDDAQSLQKEFVLCGWFLDYTGSQKGYVSQGFLDGTGVKQTDFTQGSLKITLKNPLYSEQEIVEMQQAIGLSGTQLIFADYDTISNFCKMIAVLAALLFMIFASGYLFIYNALYISISKDIRYYGQLKTIGMTSVQMKRMVYLQAFWNALAGIPAGLAAAAAVSQLVVPRILQAVNPAIPADGIVSINPWIFLVAGGFALLVNWSGSRKPAKIVGECSAIEAIRYTAGMNRRKFGGKGICKQSGKGIRKREHSGIYAMAMQNMFRDKKQAVIIFASFIIAISVFLIINVVILANDGRHILSETETEDLRFIDQTVLEEEKAQVITEEKINQIKAVEGVKSVRRVTSARVIIPYQEEVYGAYFKELHHSRYSPGNYEEDLASYQQNPGNALYAPRLIGIDKKGFQVLCEGLGEDLSKDLNWDDFNCGKAAVAVKGFTEGDNGITGKTVRFFLPDGAEPGKEHRIRIAAVGGISDNPAFFSGGCMPDLIVSEQYAEKLLKNPLTELVNVEYEEAFSAETEKKALAVFEGEKRISHDSKLDLYNDMKNAELSVKVLGNSLGFIIAMLAALNYLNMTAVSLLSRAKEFAGLESIGMTAKQTRKMLRAEGVGYVAISIVLALAAGLPASYAVFCGVNVHHISFAVPWLNNLILFAVFLLLCMAAPVLIYQKTQKRSIVERLRSGE